MEGVGKGCEQRKHVRATVACLPYLARGLYMLSQLPVSTGTLLAAPERPQRPDCVSGSERPEQSSVTCCTPGWAK